MLDEAPFGIEPGQPSEQGRGCARRPRSTQRSSDQLVRGGGGVSATGDLKAVQPADEEALVIGDTLFDEV